MIPAKDLEFELHKQVALTEAASPLPGNVCAFTWYFVDAYKRLLPPGVLYDDVRDATEQALNDYPLLRDKLPDLPWIALHLFLEKVTPLPVPLGEFKDVATTKRAVAPFRAALLSMEEDELVNSMEALFTATDRGLGEMNEQTHKKTANAIALVRFFFQLLEDKQCGDGPIGSFFAIALTGIPSLVEGAQAIEYLYKHARNG